jgi:hypothetical protein
MMMREQLGVVETNDFPLQKDAGMASEYNEMSLDMNGDVFHYVHRSLATVMRRYWYYFIIITIA